ncbi:large conductance mechanosensitive channel protein MscL [Labrys monachus]|uniref:Large-conductance mechanosensitive channel n=1 Tax=Labrys monachus TaxID=217067 RepID=A0ABU0FDC5_9HYPH|nr:large conductance mechanosensitive channel protein MscL [Labrys monachus]MDQ0392606.1 large conductance mechanosensitive channel [Labrys monachus]
MLQEFKEFALKGNVVDLAIGVIIGAAFGKIVTSLVEDVIMPIVSALTPGGLDFSNVYFMLRGTAPAGASLADARKVGVPFAIGSFITVVIGFLIIAFVLFLAVKLINTLRRQQPPKESAKPEAPADVKLLTEIRDLLAARQ